MTRRPSWSRYRGLWSALEGTGKSRNGSTYYLILGPPWP